MKLIKVPRGTARAKRRTGGEMLPPSAAAQAQQAADRKAANVKMGIALFQKHGTAHLPY